MSSTKKGYKIAKTITDTIIKRLGVEEPDLNQVTIQMHPHISNALFRERNETLAEERLVTICALARALDDENFQKSVKALCFVINKEGEKP